MARQPRDMTVIDQAAAEVEQSAELPAEVLQGQRMQDAEALMRKMLESGGADALLAAGSLRALSAVATVADSMALSLYENLTNSKAYKKVPRKSGDASPFLTIDEFCQEWLGRSARRMREIASNRKLLGEDLFEASEQMGFRERDYRLIKALPEDDRQAVRQAIEQAQRDGDPEAALAVLAEFAAKQREAKDKAEQARQAAEAKAADKAKDYEALSSLYTKAKTELRRLKDGDEIPMIDEQMADWHKSSGYLIGSMRQDLVRIGLMIDAAESRVHAVVDAAGGVPADDSPEGKALHRACESWHQRLYPDLVQFEEEVYAIRDKLDRIVGAFARGPQEDSNP